jgi:hypothetical protein
MEKSILELEQLLNKLEVLEKTASEQGFNLRVLYAKLSLKNEICRLKSRFNYYKGEFEK